MIISLSYQLNDLAFGYGNGTRFKLTYASKILDGNTSNNTLINTPTHYGTHIDFPFHFSQDGKKSSDYPIDFFLFDCIDIIEIDASKVNNLLIMNKDINIGDNKSAELLFVKTGFCEKRYSNEYWEYGFGFHSETADYLKKNYPNLKVIAFDLISLNSYQHRPEGRRSHKEFLLKHDVLIVEDVNLKKVNKSTVFNNVVISPLLIENADGAPVTIIADIND